MYFLDLAFFDLLSAGLTHLLGVSTHRRSVTLLLLD